jgi:phosphoglycolate phosphatase
MTKAIIFDYDETLVQTLDARIQAYIQLAKQEYHFDLKEEKIRQAFGLPYEVFITTLFGEVDSVENIIANYQKITPNFPNKAYPHAVETVNKLLIKYFVGVVSGSRRNMMLADMKKLGFPIDKFFYIQSGEDTEVHKPDPKVFDPLIKKLNTMDIKPEEALYVGDDLRDFEASIKAGIQYVAIANHTTEAKLFKSQKIPYMLSFEDFSSKYRESLERNFSQ